MYSLWEKQSFLTADIIIIGAGITGLSAAASLKEINPEMEVIVLERGLLPTGASTKGAGFACFGSASELLSDIEVLDVDGMTALVEMRWKGLEKTQTRLGKNSIDLQIKSGYELILDEQSKVIEKLDEINGYLHPIFGRPVFKASNDKISTFGFGATHHLIENEVEGQLDTGKLIQSLWKYCNQQGVRIHTGCEVTDIQEPSNGVEVICDRTSFHAQKVAVCTNAFTNSLLKEVLDLIPGRGIMMSIHIKDSLRFEGTFHYNEGYYYFRDYYGTLLFGGGRNLALKDEETTRFEVNQRIKEKLIDDLREIILPGQPFEIAHEWVGIMAFGATKKPIIQRHTPNIVVGARLGGMGVAIGSIVGEEVAHLLLE